MTSRSPIRISLPGWTASLVMSSGWRTNPSGCYSLSVTRGTHGYREQSTTGGTRDASRCFCPLPAICSSAEKRIGSRRLSTRIVLLLEPLCSEWDLPLRVLGAMLDPETQT